MLRVISKQSANQARIELKWNCCESDETKEEKITKKKNYLKNNECKREIKFSLLFSSSPIHKSIQYIHACKISSNCCMTMQFFSSLLFFLSFFISLLLTMLLMIIYILFCFSSSHFDSFDHWYVCAFNNNWILNILSISHFDDQFQSKFIQCSRTNC